MTTPSATVPARMKQKQATVPSSPGAARPASAGVQETPPRTGRSRRTSGRGRGGDGSRSLSAGWSGALQRRRGGNADSSSLLDSSMQDLHVTEPQLKAPIIAAVEPPSTPPSDAVVLPADPSFPSESKSIPAALRASRRTLAALPFKNRGSRRSSKNLTRDLSPNPNNASVELPSPNNRGGAAAPTESPPAPAQTPSRGASGPVVAFRNYTQFLFSGRGGEIQAAPPLSMRDECEAPPSATYTLSNPPAEPRPLHETHAPPALPQPLLDTHEGRDDPPQELAIRTHSRHPSVHTSEDDYKMKDAAAAVANPEGTMDPSAMRLDELEHKGSSFAVGRLRSESTMMALETIESVAYEPPASSSFDASSLPRSTREWRPRGERSSNKIIQGAAQRPGRHRYTYGNESMRVRQVLSPEIGRSPSRTTPTLSPAPRGRMVRQGSNFSLASAGTPLELKGDYDSTKGDYDSFMVADDPRDSGDKPRGGVLSKLAPYDSTNVRPAAYAPEAPRSASGLGPRSFSTPQNLNDAGQARREWKPRYVRSKSKLELGGERSDGSGFAYSFMYGIGSDHEAAMQEVLRSGREERARKREERRERSNSVASRGAADRLSPQPRGYPYAAVASARGGSVRQQSPLMSAMDGGGVSEFGVDEGSCFGEEARVEYDGSRGVVDFGGVKLPVGPSFKQYCFPMGRDFRFSDGHSVPVPLERLL